ncbi:hypothetical protein, partial [Oceanimonas baumannii]
SRLVSNVNKNGQVEIPLTCRKSCQGWGFRNLALRIPLDHIIEQGFEELVHNKDRNVKIIVSPSRDYATEGTVS